MFLRHLNFCLNIFGNIGTRLDKKAKPKPKVNFKIYDVINWETIQILPNILRSKGNQTTKSGQLIEYNLKYIFLEKS